MKWELGTTGTIVGVASGYPNIANSLFGALIFGCVFFGFGTMCDFLSPQSQSMEK